MTEQVVRKFSIDDEIDLCSLTASNIYNSVQNDAFIRGLRSVGGIFMIFLISALNFSRYSETIGEGRRLLQQRPGAGIYSPSD